MRKAKNLFHDGMYFDILLLILISGLAYLIFIPKFGYFNDDWYLMYAAGAKGQDVFKNIFIIDRPMRSLVMSLAYGLFGSNPILYNLSAWGFRTLSGVLFYRFLSLLWSRQNKMVWMGSLLYIIYPGFLSQFNGIDYQSQMVSLAVGMLSLLLLFYAYKSPSLLSRFILFVFLVISTTFYLGLVEYFIGMEIFKFACVLMLVFRDETAWFGRIKRSMLWVVYSFLALIPFLIWRLFFFHSERGATDVNVKFSDVLASPVESLAGWLSTLLKNIVDVLFGVWIEPLQRLTVQLTIQQWFFGLVITGLILILIWRKLRVNETSDDDLASFKWRREAIWLGTIMLVFGLLPIILVGRYVDFDSFSRYALAPSIGVALLWQAGLAFIPNMHFRNILFALLVISCSLTHYGNSISYVRETAEMNQFWWQVSWRIPQMEQGTTLLVNYPDITIEEDYFIWGPANLIYYPASMHRDYPQPGIYSLLINTETIDKVLAQEKQDFRNRRSIRTYPNYRNVLILTQPTDASCVQVISGSQTEYSSFEDKRIVQIGAYSDVDHIQTQDSPHQPPKIPFGLEPEHGWCFYYEKAALARQLGDWKEVLRLAGEVGRNGLNPNDQIEWIPFLQAYALVNDVDHLREINISLTDILVEKQVCQILGGMTDLTKKIHSEINALFCSK